jgi:hypothetical protein
MATNPLTPVGGSPGSGAFNLAMICAIPVDESLNNSFEPVLIVVRKRKEAEWLQAPGQRTQHFRRTQYHSSPGQKHQFCAAPGVDRMRHGKQAASQRNNLQFSRDTAAVTESQDRWSPLSEMHSRGPLTGLGLGKGHS